MAGIFYSTLLPSIILLCITLPCVPFDLPLGEPLSIVGKEIVHKELKLCRNHHGYWVYAPAAPRLRHSQNPLSSAQHGLAEKTVEPDDPID